MATTGRGSSEKVSRDVKNSEPLEEEWTPRGRREWGPQKVKESFKNSDWQSFGGNKSHFDNE